VPPPRNSIVELRLFWYCTLPFLCRPAPLVQEKATRWLGWLPKACHTQTAMGFTLAELLISLAILGVIATFTIPKIIAAQTNEQYNASTKDVAAMITGAYTSYSQNNTPSASTSAGNLTPFMNYLATDSSTTIDLAQTNTTRACGGGYGCIKLHNGGMLMWASAGFMGTNTTNAVYFYFDPDGVVTDGTTNGPGKSVGLWLYYNNRITSYGNLTSGTVYGGGTVNPHPTYDPPWFSW
jgi:prepilin-type N-terminal cleavage/methylation domain-containing protein